MFEPARAMARSVLDRVFNDESISSDSEDIYSPSADNEETSEEAETISEGPGPSVQREEGVAAISSGDSDSECPKTKS